MGAIIIVGALVEHWRGYRIAESTSVLIDVTEKYGLALFWYVTIDLRSNDRCEPVQKELFSKFCAV